MAEKKVNYEQEDLEKRNAARKVNANIMCKICSQLVNTPKNKKSTVILNEYESEFTNYDKTFIEVNHTDNGERYAFITHVIQMKDNRTWSHPVDISHCPFCGQNLLNKIIEED